jgi:uncharacterized membrane protein YphA (DoxX/SURF4 family)
MRIRSVPRQLLFCLTLLIGSVWIFHGLYSKLLNGIPRHRAIVGRVLGEEWATPMTMAVGILEIILGLWALSRWRRRECALVQTLAIVTMNSLEIVRARDLVLSAPGMLILNATFLIVVWLWALAPGSGSDR